MIKYSCDNCGKEMEEKEVFEIKIHFKSLDKIKHLVPDSKKWLNYQRHYCEHCHSLFIESLDKRL